MTIGGVDEYVTRTPKEEAEFRATWNEARAAAALRSLAYIHDEATANGGVYYARTGDSNIVAYLQSSGWVSSQTIRNPAGHLVAGVKDRVEVKLTEAGLAKLAE
jgi:hypothetical protein